LTGSVLTRSKALVFEALSCSRFCMDCKCFWMFRKPTARAVGLALLKIALFARSEYSCGTSQFIVWLFYGQLVWNVPQI
jgi:hypothetical protein